MLCSDLPRGHEFRMTLIRARVACPFLPAGKLQRRGMGFTVTNQALALGREVTSAYQRARWVFSGLIAIFERAAPNISATSRVMSAIVYWSPATKRRLASS